MITLRYLKISLLILLCSSQQNMLFAQKQGTALIDSLKEDIQTSNNDTAKAKTLSQLSLTIAGSDIDSALKYANECMEISKKAEWTKGVGLAYYALAFAKFRAADYTTSQQYSLEAYNIAKGVNDKKNMAIALRIIGWNNDWLGYYSKALENYFSALRLFEETNDKRGIASCYNSIGGVYYYTYDYSKAMEYYNKSLRGMQELNDQPGIASAYMNIASVFKDLKKYDSSASYNLEAIKIYEAVNDQVALGKAYYNRGNLMMMLYDAKSAYEYYMKAIEIFKKSGSKIDLADKYSAIGVLYLTLVKDSIAKYTLPPLLNTNKTFLLQQAQYYFLQALALTKEEGELTLSMDYVDLLSQTQEELGNYKAALAYHKEYMIYKDSIFNDENKKKIADLETQRLTEVKNKEIELKNSELKRQTLIRNIILISAAAAALLTFVFIRLYNRRRKIKFDTQVKEVEMKALRSQMNPHFIFNSLHSINKYVIENDKENASAYLSKFANLMRLILENSREQEVPLEKDLDALELYMQLEALRFKNKFTYNIQTALSIDKENTLIPPMLLQPFAENAIIHGMQDKQNGHIQILVSKENNMMKCVVEDNGTGRQNVVSAQADAEKKRQSLGIKIITERLNIINQLKKVKTALNVLDLKNTENKSGGLRIELLLPFEQAF